MVIYFADRRMTILGMASTELMEGFTISNDLKSEDTDTGVATFECTIHWTDDTRALAEAATTAGNYLLRSYNYENEFYTIIEVEVDTKDQSIYIYAEDAGMDLLNETVGAFEADEAHPAEWYVLKYAEDTGFEIGINEISDLSRKLQWTGTATAAERIASVATQFDNAEISYSFDIQGLTITHKYINIHKKRGKDAGVQLRLNRDVDRIITTTSVADLATALYVTGGTPEDSEDPVTLAGYSYDDGDMYVEDGLLKSREALKVWSRYVWAKEPNQIEGYTGHIVKQWSYDTTSQSELCNRAITQLGKVCEPAVNYEIDIQMLPANVGIGDYVDIVDEKGELYLSSRILKLTTSACNQQQTATLGEFLIVESGISQTIKELAEQFSQLAKSRQYYIWIVYADDEYGDGISLDPEGKTYMGTCTTSEGPDPDLSDPSRYKWSLIQGENGVGIEEINTYYGLSDSPTDVPTVWQDEPYELMHNEYQWSYTEIIYTNGVVELTSPTIIAYYDYLNVDELEARVAKIEEAYVSYEEVELLVADDVEAAIVNAGFLTADSAIITSLTAFSENVYTLLGGEGSFGELQSIHLTSDNAVIDEAVIVNAIAGTVLADIITSNIIYTDQITIMSEDGGIILAGTTMQFSDENGTVRLQLGQDADGNFTFVLYDETGTGIMIDSEGIHASAVPDGLIVNDMVSDDAAISGWKLDIASVAECLNADGSLILDAAQITINETTLSAWYTEVSEELEGLAGLTSEGLMNVEPWFCLWDSSTPPADEDLTPAICGEAICGDAVCGMTDGTLWVDHDIDIVDGLYKWVKWKGYYADGHEEWGDPYCLTDGYLRQETSVLQTQLEVVQGEISAKIWMTDITEEISTSITDLWATLDITLDSITAQMGDLETEVHNVSDKSVIASTAYFCLWHSATEAPPDDGEITEAICGVAICGLAYCGVTDGKFWSTDEPADAEGEYKWIRYLLEYADGHEEWQKPYCLTDDFTREQVDALYGEVDSNYQILTSRLAEIEITTESITSTVYYVQQTLTDFESTTDSRFTQVEQTMDGISSTVVSMQSSISTMEGEVESQGELISGAYSQIEQLADSVSIQIGDLQGEISASLVLQINPETGHAEMVGDADYIYLYGNQIVIQSDNFSLTEDGMLYAVNAYLEGDVVATSLYATNAYLEGTIEADGGHIGGFTIGTSSLYNGKSSYSSDDSGVYIGTDGISLGSGFKVNTRGRGNFGNWIFGENKIYNDLDVYEKTAVMQAPNDNMTWVFACGGESHDAYRDCPFRVDKDGNLYAKGATFGGIAYFPDTGMVIANYYYNSAGVYFYNTDQSSYACALARRGDVTYLGNSSGNSTIQGSNAVYLIADNVYAQPSSGGYFHIYNSYGDMSMGTSGASNMGVYDYGNNRWIVRRDSSYRTVLGNDERATILYGNGVYLNGTSTAVTSDRTFKDNITPFEPETTNALTDKLTPKIYTVASDPETKHIGFIVDEVEDAMRAAGYNPAEYGLTDSYEDDEGNEMGAIRYDEFIPILLYEIQELRDRVNALENPEEGLIDPGIELN